ncbi:MAG: DNA polymerase III subunit beta [Saprospiraceae bacterium]|nr:DNA polymerase III subunit beta [Saprospiraceae bacterium]
MKFSASSADLLKKIQIANGAVGTNAVVPILEDFLFQVDGNELTISATDLETSITTKMEVIAESGGEVAIPGKILVDTLKALPEQPITIDVEEGRNSIEITSSYGKYKLSGDNAEEFPTIPSPQGTETVTMGASTLNEAIAKTVFATSNDELRLAMTGVYVQLDFSKMIFVATDAHKLVKYSFSGLESEANTSFIIPKKSLTLLRNALPQSGQIEIAFNKSNAFFTFDDHELVCRLIDAQYPNYNAVIPVENPNRLTVVRADLLQSLKRIAIYANKTTNQVILNIDDGSLTIESQDIDFSNEATEQLTCQYEGEPITIGFNARFLIDMLSVLDTDDIVICMSSPNKAGIILPAEEPEDEELLMLVMPVMLSRQS